MVNNLKKNVVFLFSSLFLPPESFRTLSTIFLVAGVSTPLLFSFLFPEYFRTLSSIFPVGGVSTPLNRFFHGTFYIVPVVCSASGVFHNFSEGRGVSPFTIFHCIPSGTFYLVPGMISSFGVLSRPH